ncbi:MAG: flagellar export chaperone FliS [Anaerovoracaceae bacterium]
MDYSKQLDNYKKQSVYSMTQGEMLLLLYDELIKRLNRGKLWLEKEKIPEFEKDIKRAQEIIQYLRKILDMKIPISSELARLYAFYEGHTARILVSRKAEQIDELLPMIQDLRDAFKQADIMVRSGQQAAL